MPIEDVDYLRQNSTKQSYLFLVNSSERNREAYPTPSHYVVEFSAPFQNVIGFQVLDASIPRTMYNVDAYNCELRFLIHARSRTDLIGTPSAYQTVRLTLGEYSIQSLLVELNRVLKMRLNMDASEPWVSIAVETTTLSPEIQSRLRFRCPYPFVLDMGESSAAETLGFDLWVDPQEALVPPQERGYDPSLVGSSRRKFHSVDLPATVAVSDHETTVFEGPRGVVRKAPVGNGAQVAQQFTVATATFLTSVWAAFTTADGTVPSQANAVWELYHDASGQPGTHIPLVTADGSTITGRIPVSFTNGALSDPAQEVQVPLTPGVYWVVFSSTFPLFLYFNDVPQAQRQGTLAARTSSQDAWVSQDTPEGIHFEGCVRVTARDEYHQLKAPGIFSLIGERYVVLRCPEIEENSYRSLAYQKHCLGLAKFQLGILGYTESRQDFSTVPLREFHPIGRLSRITLRFETPGGKLYDFKGVNHNLTIAIHYLEPIQKKVFERSLINPNYTGDIIGYLYASEPESDEQDYDYSEDTLREYRDQEARHLPQRIRDIDLEALYRMGFTDDADDAAYETEEEEPREGSDL